MNVEVLVSTMFRKNLELIEKMNIRTNATIVNQTNFSDEKKIKNKKGNIINFISNTQRGLSKSRNVAIKEATADICVFADDDVIYVDDYEDIIERSYHKYEDADLIVFKVPSKGNRKKEYSKKEKKLNSLSIFKVSSVEITFKRQSIIENQIFFNENFGAGSGKYNMGEENIFLKECIKRKLKIYYIPKKIGYVNQSDSTWFEGFNKKYFFDRGAIFCALSRKISYLYAIQFAIRKFSLYKKNIKFLDALKYMYKGIKDYKRMIKK